ncbi:MAG: hypothetical protein WA211_14515 [Candidatus Acidiferrales bacterium]
MRTIAACLFVVAASGLLAPSSQELHSRYGEPDQERFTVRPGISLTVQYGSDHLACQFIVAPSKPFDATDPVASYSTMQAATVTEILEEIAPAGMRGKQTPAGEWATGCADENVEFDYENVLIVRSVNSCAPSKPNPENTATLYLKRNICPKPHIPLVQRFSKSP